MRIFAELPTVSTYVLFIYTDIKENLRKDKIKDVRLKIKIIFLLEIWYFNRWLKKMKRKYKYFFQLILIVTSLKVEIC